MTSSNPPPAPSPLDAEPFELTSISKAEPPAGVETANWHRYVITQGPNKIAGFLQGAPSEIEKAALEIVERLNERRRGKTGRSHQGSGRRKSA